MALPIAPNTVFFASANPKTKDKARKMTPSKIAFAVNEETIWRSTTVYAADKSLASFLTPQSRGKGNRHMAAKCALIAAILEGVRLNH